MKYLINLLAAVLLFAGASQAQVTTIYVYYSNGVDKPMVNDTTAPADIKVSVTVTKPNGAKETFTVTSQIINNQTTRRQLAADIAEKLKQAFTLCDIPTDWVTHRGESVYVQNTTPGEGENKGTKDDPIKSPEKAKNGHGHVRVYTN